MNPADEWAFEKTAKSPTDALMQPFMERFDTHIRDTVIPELRKELTTPETAGAMLTLAKDTVRRGAGEAWDWVKAQGPQLINWAKQHPYQAAGWASLPIVLYLLHRALLRPPQPPARSMARFY